MVETLDCTDISLRKNAKGEKVTLLQKNLKLLGFYQTAGGKTLKVDGEYLVYTEQAVKAFQKSVGGLAIDGWFGPVTCKKMNEKLLAKDAETKKQEEEKNTATQTTVTPSKPDPYAANPKNNVWYSQNPNVNLNIDGIWLIGSSVTRTNAYHSGSWKTIQLMNGKNYFYKDRPSPREYSVDCYVPNLLYGSLSVEFDKMGERVCKVTTRLFPSGYYVVGVTVADEKTESKKITLKFTEYLTG